MLIRRARRVDSRPGSSQNLIWVKTPGAAARSNQSALWHFSRAWLRPEVSAGRTMRQLQQRQQACGRRIWTAAFMAALGVVSAHAAPLPPLERASWVWSQESDARCGLRKVFTLGATPAN